MTLYSEKLALLAELHNAKARLAEADALLANVDWAANFEKEDPTLMAQSLDAVAVYVDKHELLPTSTADSAGASHG
jgi:hypothetical protein